MILPSPWSKKRKGDCVGHHISSRGGQNDDFRPLTYTLGGGAWGAGTNMWHPETLASYELLPAPLATQIPTLWIHTSGGGGRGGGGSDIRLMSSIRPICECRCPPLLEITRNGLTAGCPKLATRRLSDVSVPGECCHDWTAQNDTRKTSPPFRIYKS